MTNITINPNCGNSPKKKFLSEFNIAVANGNADFILDNLSDDIHWQIVGVKELKGKGEFAKEIDVMKGNIMNELKIDTIITHGKEAAVSGEKIIDDKVYAFCDIYNFKSATGTIVAGLQSYIIKISG